MLLPKQVVLRCTVYMDTIITREILAIRLVDNLNFVPAVGSRVAIRYWPECNQDVTFNRHSGGCFPPTGSRLKGPFRGPFARCCSCLHPDGYYFPALGSLAEIPRRLVDDIITEPF